jgi:transposase-like protein
MKTEFKTLAGFMATFPDEAACRKYFEQIRFAKGDYCPHCKHDKIMRFADGKRYRCAKCRKDFTIKTGTLFGESKISMDKWFTAIYLLTTRKKGISSIELAEQVGVSQKTAWFMDHRIRASFKQSKAKLLGVVEVDETYLGGKHARKDKFKKKAALFGMTERGGRIRVFHVPHRGTEILLPTIKKNIHPKARIMSDEARVYSKLPRFGYQWGSVKHGKRHWVYGDISTNSIESFWALFKRNYHGTYHTMSKKHLQKYIDEVCFRFNNRNTSMQDMFADVTRRVAKSGKLSLRKLTA